MPPTNWARDGRRSFPAHIRREIIERDGCCVRCGSTDQLQADHITPHAKATRLGWTPEQIDHPCNGQTLCRSCHRTKTINEIAQGRQRRQRSTRREPEVHPGLLR